MYEPQTWENEPSKATPLSAERFNHMEDGIAAAHAELDGRLSEAGLSLTIDGAVAEAPLEPREALNITYRGADAPRPVGSFDGFLWGAVGGQLKRSSDGGETWTSVGTAAPEDVRRVALTADGEMLAVAQRTVYRTTGWAGNPGSASWASVLATPDADTFIADFSMDLNDPARQTFLFSHYTGTTSNWFKSRYVWMSTDAGKTFSVVYDSVALYGAAANDSHIHGICYDSWASRLWVSEGHETVVGVRWSDNWGGSWTKISKGELAGITMSPTTLVATPTGIICASDSEQNGVYGIARVDSPADLAMEWIWQWRMVEGWQGAPGFGQGGWYDPASRMAYISFQTSESTLSPVIVAGDAITASPVATIPKKTTDGTVSVNFAFTIGNRLVATSDIPGKERIYADIVGKGTKPAHRYNRGNIFGGNAPSPLSVSSGLDSRTGKAHRSVAVGVGASVADAAHNSVAIGHLSQAGQQREVLIGAGATASGTDAVGIGYGAKPGSESVAIGTGANLGGELRTVVLGLAATSKSESAVLGYGAAGAGNLSVLVGHMASATHADGRSVSVGHNVLNEQMRSVVIGGAAKAGPSAASIGSVVVGERAEASSSGSVVLGSQAGAADAGVAVGALAKAPFSNAVALGYNTKATDLSQVAVGARHFELATSSPGAPAAGLGRVYLFDNAGTPELRIRTSSGIRRIVTEVV